jgi:hypothetical protein
MHLSIVILALNAEAMIERYVTVDQLAVDNGPGNQGRHR